MSFKEERETREELLDIPLGVSRILPASPRGCHAGYKQTPAMHAQKWWQTTNYHVFHTNWNKACSTINITKLYFGMFYTKMKCSLKQCFYNVCLTPLFHFNIRSIMLVVEHSPSYLKQTWARKKQSHEKRERVNFTPTFAHASNENYTRFKRFETCRVTSQSYFQAID